MGFCPLFILTQIRKELGPSPSGKARVLRGDEGENSTQKRPSNMGPRDLSSMTHTLTRPGPRNAFHLLGEVPGCLPGFTFH